MRFKLFFVLLLTGLLVAACGGGAEPDPTQAPAADAGQTESAAAEEPTAETDDTMMDEAPMPDPLAVSGNVVTAGSSTVFPLTERMVERYLNEGFGGDITIDSIGSGAGFSRFCEGGET